MLQITPTATLTDLTRNNTSAADSFAGWLPGLDHAANLSHVPLNLPQKAFTHRCDWWDTDITLPGGGVSKRTNGSHPDIGIRSYDPAYCARTAVDMKLRGLAGAFLDWYGPGSYEDKAALALKPALEAAGLQFALCVDGGIKAIKAATTDAARTTALLQALAYARSTYFGASSYLRDAGKPMILFFGFATGDFDWAKVRAAYADCKLIFRWELNYSPRAYADGYFGWTANSEAWIADVQKRAPGKLIIFGINGRFNNTDPVLCPWGKANPKVIEAQGGMVLQSQLEIARKHPEILYLSVNTWNDYQEKSALEMGIPSGLATALAFQMAVDNGILSWQDPGPMFDRVDLYVSLDGTNLMPMAIARGVTTVDLKPIDFDEGTYHFWLQAVGKPMVQNLLSNQITATLGWS